VPGASQLQLLIGEIRASRDVAEQRKGELSVIAEHIGRDRQEVVPCARGDAAAHAFDRRGDLFGVAGRRTLRHQLRHQPRDAFLARGIVGVAGAETQADRQRGLLVVLDEQQRHPVGQRDLPKRRELYRPESTGDWWTGWERLLGG